MIMIVCMILIYFAVGMISFFSATDKNHEKNTVRMGVAFLIIGVICTVACTVPAIIMVLQKKLSFAAFLFGLSLLGASLVVAFFNCRLTYDEESFTYRNFFNKKTTIKYSEIIDAEYDMDLIIMSDKKKISLQDHAVGQGEFLQIIKPYIDPIIEQKKKIAGPAPKVRKYRDSVYRPLDYIIVQSIFGAFSGAICLAALIIDFNWICVFVLALISVFIFAFFYSAKRAHSSEFWRSVSKICYHKNQLKPSGLIEPQEEKYIHF